MKVKESQQLKFLTPYTIDVYAHKFQSLFSQEIKSELYLLLFSSLIFIKLKPMSHKNPKNKHVLVA